MEYRTIGWLLASGGLQLGFGAGFEIPALVASGGAFIAFGVLGLIDKWKGMIKL